MPAVLRYAAIMGLGLGVIFSIIPLVPGGTFHVSGTALSWRELWETRVALALFVVGPLLVTIGVGLLLKTKWVRPLLILLPAVLMLPFLVVHWLFTGPNPIPTPSWFALQSLVWGIVVALYLFRGPASRGYFNGEA